MKVLDIFIVEDNPADIFLITEFFKKQGRQVRLSVFSDGEMAINFLKTINHMHQEFWPELIILDLNLPKKSGKEVLNYIKADELLKVIPVVIFSTSSAPEEIKNLYDLHANCYVVKPFDIDLFQKAIATIYNYWFNTAALAIKK